MKMSVRRNSTVHAAPVLKVDVTQEVIDHSVAKDSSHCMIAEAIAVAYPNASFISVDLATIRFTDLTAGFRYIYLTPRHAQAALLDFDQGNKPVPFKFNVAAAQIVASGSGEKKARAAARMEKLRTTDESEPATTVEKQRNTDPESGRVVKGGGNSVVRVGGQTPPVGPLAHHRDANSRPTNRVGRRREFGLRAIIR
jgi:hypothetical protein